MSDTTLNITESNPLNELKMSLTGENIQNHVSLKYDLNDHCVELRWEILNSFNGNKNVRPMKRKVNVTSIDFTLMEGIFRSIYYASCVSIQSFSQHDWNDDNSFKGIEDQVSFSREFLDIFVCARPQSRTEIYLTVVEISTPSSARYCEISFSSSECRVFSMKALSFMSALSKSVLPDYTHASYLNQSPEYDVLCIRRK